MNTNARRSRSLIAVALASISCTPSTQPSAPTPERPWRELPAHASFSAREWSPENTTLSEDIGLAPSALSDSALLALLSHRLTLPSRIAVAVLHLPGGAARRWGFDGGLTELSQVLADSAVQVISRVPRVLRAVPLPSMLLPTERTVAAIREATARLQADVVLVYRPSCRLYERTPFVGRTQYRAVCTLQAILLDARSGVIPTATVVTREFVTQHQKGDFDDSETVRRAQLAAITSALADVSAHVAVVIGKIPSDDRAP